MPNIAGTITWTPQDEERLRALTERKALFESRMKAPVAQFVLDKYEWQSSSTHSSRQQMSKKVAEWLIKNADTIRDLLKPFDSSVTAPRVEPAGGLRNALQALLDHYLSLNNSGDFGDLKPDDDPIIKQARRELAAYGE